jgi:hypothetical protein
MLVRQTADGMLSRDDAFVRDDPVHVDGKIATITLNRPDELNTIVAPLPDAVEAAVTAAEAAEVGLIKLIVNQAYENMFAVANRDPDDMRLQIISLA